MGQFDRLNSQLVRGKIHVGGSMYVAKIKTKMIFYFSLFSLFISLIFGYLIFVYLKENATEEAEKTFYQGALDAADIVKAKNEIYYEYLKGIASREKIIDKNTSIDEKLALLKKEVQKSGKFRRMGIADLDGKLYMFSQDEKQITKMDVSERLYFKKAVAGSLYVQNPLQSLNPEDNKATIVVYGVPIYDEAEIVGVLVASNVAWSINELTNGLRFSEDEYAYIMDEDGNLIAHPNKILLGKGFNVFDEVGKDGSLLSFMQMYQKSLREDSGILRYIYQDKPIIAGFSKIEGTNWKIYLASPQNTVFGFLQSLQRVLIFYTCIIIAFTVLIYYKLRNEIEVRNAQLKVTHRRLEYQANHDELTGVHNRRSGLKLLEEMAETSRCENKELTVAYLDIDNLKVVNDSMGHHTGDELIFNCISMISKCIRRTDKICRLGGDEFLIIFYDCSEEQCSHILKNITAEFEYFNRISDREYEVHFSYGISTYGEKRHLTLDDLIREADEKMYFYKKRKKDWQARIKE